MQTQVEHPSPASASAKSVGKRRVVLIVAGVLLACIVAAVVFALRAWPFTRDSVVSTLQNASEAAVQIAKFRQTYFPPGCVAEGVTFRYAGQSGTPFITVSKLVIMGGYTGLLHHHIKRVSADGLHLAIASKIAAARGPGGANIAEIQSGLTIGEIVADNAEVEFPPVREGSAPTVVRTPKLTLHDIARGRPIVFEALVQVPQPPALVRTTGKVGPWRTGGAAETPLSGSFTVQNLDLGSLGGVRGDLSGQGNFAGVLRQVNVQGTTDVPRFEVTASHHHFHLASQFQAVVNGVNGDVKLSGALVHWGHTTVLATGAVAGTEGQEGKTASLELSSRQGRIEDLLLLFTTDKLAPAAGAIVFHGSAILPPDRRPFLEKVQLDGDFGISSAHYTNPETQKTLDVLSARARGKADEVEDAGPGYDPGRVLSNLKGHVVLRNAVAHLSNITFDVPAAAAKLHGTFNVENERVDLHGYMHMDTELSNATTGVKSILLKVIQPFMRKGKHNQSVVSLGITGTYAHPQYTVVPVAAK